MLMPGKHERSYQEDDSRKRYCVFGVGGACILVLRRCSTDIVWAGIQLGSLSCDRYSIDRTSPRPAMYLLYIEFDPELGLVHAFIAIAPSCR